MNGLTKRGWTCRVLAQPVFDRARGGCGAKLSYLAALGSVWIAATALLFHRGSGHMCVGLGQTRTALVRDLVPLLLARLRLGRERVIVALNGNLFMHWPERSLETRLFRLVLRQAGTVAVVGERQRTRLTGFAVPRLNVEVVVNSCDIEAIPSASVAAKHRRTESSAPVRLLYLSSLIDTKGYPEYLEALEQFAAADELRIDAVLCGRIVASEFSQRFPSAGAAKAWIEARLGTINRSSRVRARWVDGAAGAEKVALLHAAHVFVLPTRYPVEAQPLALLEAMASGCAIVTTAAGEIPTILDEGCARFLSGPSASVLAAALDPLVRDEPARVKLATAAHGRFVTRYQVDRHLDRWETLLAAGSRATSKEAT